MIKLPTINSKPVLLVLKSINLNTFSSSPFEALSWDLYRMRMLRISLTGKLNFLVQLTLSSLTITDLKFPYHYRALRQRSDKFNSTNLIKSRPFYPHRLRLANKFIGYHKFRKQLGGDTRLLFTCNLCYASGLVPYLL